MSSWQEPIEWEATELFAREERADFCALEPPEVGLRLNLDAIAYDEPRLAFSALITWTLPRDLARSFQRIDHALVLAIENAATGQALCTRLVDPHKRFPAMQGANYVAPARIAPDSYKTGFLEAPIELGVPTPPFAPSLFVRVLLNEYSSNLMAIDVEEAKADSFLDGEPAPIVLLGDEAS